MRTYIARRVLHGLLVLLLVSFAIFSLVRILPGDAVLVQLDQAAAPTPEMLARAAGARPRPPVPRAVPDLDGGRGARRSGPFVDQPPTGDPGAPQAPQPHVASGRDVHDHRPAHRPA